jgi:hypothetical protein
MKPTRIRTAIFFIDGHRREPEPLAQRFFAEEVLAALGSDFASVFAGLLSVEGLLSAEALLSPEGAAVAVATGAESFLAASLY